MVIIIIYSLVYVHALMSELKYKCLLVRHAEDVRTNIHIQFGYQHIPRAFGGD